MMTIKQNVMANGKRWWNRQNTEIVCGRETTLHDNSTVTDLSSQLTSKPQKDDTKNEPA